MPSSRHEIMTQVVLRQPEGPPSRALARLLGPGPLGSLTVTDPVLRPAALPESRPDGLWSAEEDGRPVRVVVEVQLRPDEDKARNWPWYLALTERASGALAVMLVVALDRSTAAWARRLVDDDPRLAPRVAVIGPEDVPRFDALPIDQRTIETALWSTAMHVQDARDLPLLAALIDPALPWWSDFRQRNDYVGAVMRLLPPAVEERLRGAPMGHASTESSGMEDIAALFGRIYGEIGRRAGREEGRDEGRDEGRRQERVASARRFLLKLLQVRGVSLTPEQSSWLEQCNDAALLEGWHDRLLAGETWEQCLADAVSEAG